MRSKEGGRAAAADQKNGIDSMCAINNGSERVLQSSSDLRHPVIEL